MTVQSERSVTSRAALATLDHAVHDRAYLTEAGSEGTFVWNGSNLSAEVSLDTEKGVYVAPRGDATGASGAWVRQFAGAVSVLWFGAKGLGSSFVDGPYIQKALDFAYAKGLSVEFPADVPGFYNVRLVLIWWPGVNITGVGGYAKIKNTRRPGGSTPFQYLGIWMAGCFAIEYIDMLTRYSCGTISPGNQVILTNRRHAANFRVGQQVITASDDDHDIYPDPKRNVLMPHYLHLNRIEAVDGAVITLKYPIDVGYAGWIGDLTEVTTASGGVPEIDVPLFFAENATMSFMDCEAPDGWQSIYGAAYNVKWENCIFKGRWGSIYSNAAQHCTMSNCQVYFSYKLGEFAQASLYSGVSNCNFIFFEDKTRRRVAPDPYIGFQIGENSRHCYVSGNTIDLNGAATGPGDSSRYVFGFHAANWCTVTNNLVSGGSDLHAVAFIPQAVGLGCRNNLAEGNTFRLKSARSFVLMSMMNATDYGNRVVGNGFHADRLAPGVKASVLLNNARDSAIIRNTFNVGEISITGASAGNVVTDNEIADGSRPVTVSGADGLHRRNEIARNDGTSLTRPAVLFGTVPSIIAPASTTTEVYSVDTAAIARGSEVYDFTFLAQAIGTANAKIIRFALRNPADAADRIIFEHTIPALSDGLVIVKASFQAGIASSPAHYEATVLDEAGGTRTPYAGSIAAPSTATGPLRFVLSATLGASTSLVFPCLTAKVAKLFA